MATFELNNDTTNVEATTARASNEICGSFQNKIKTECIETLKVYDQCRIQDCLTPSLIGPARAAESVTIGDSQITEGNIITPPSDAAAVTVDCLKLDKVIIVNKEPNCFRPGFWDIDLKFVFQYNLIFREASGCIIGCLKAYSIYNKKMTMFGSASSDIVVASDILCNEMGTTGFDPFVMVEGKAVSLNAELKYRTGHCCCDTNYTSDADEVLLTIGLFAIVKVLRLVNLTVESKGFCVPNECNEPDPMNPCDFFDSLDFPFDVFSPPQIDEFDGGVSSGCGCNS